MITDRELRLLHVIAELQGRAFAPARLHKAGNAEAILKHCLRMLGFTARWKAGRLTRGQSRRLLLAIREYGRAWLRHEAEAFMAGQQAARGTRWDDTGDGYLHATDTGFLANARRFFGRAKAFIRETIVAGVMSLLGPAPLTGEELEAAEREAQKQDQYFDKFLADVEAPTPPPAQPLAPGLVPEKPLTPAPKPMTPKQFIARAEKYADSAWQSAQRINRAAAIGQGIAKRERRVLGHPKTQHCDDCPPLAEMGWQPVGSLPDIGDTECGGLCLCHFEYEDAAGKTFFQGKMGIVPSPTPPAQIEPDDDGIYPVAEPPGGLTYEVPIAGPPKRSLE